MVWNSKAEHVFGQVLICLRMSNLDYMVKETPYSAYVTIRKKFTKSVNEEMIKKVAENADVSDELTKAEKENIFLKEKVGVLETDCAALMVENGEMEINIKVLEKEKVSLHDAIEDEYTNSRDLNKKIDNLTKKNSEIKDENEMLTDASNGKNAEITELKYKVAKMEDSIEELGHNKADCVEKNCDA